MECGNKTQYSILDTVVTAHLHLVPRLRMLGAIPPFPQYVFMAWCLIKPEMNLHGVVLN